jgi:hypothetical protein
LCRTSSIYEGSPDFVNDAWKPVSPCSAARENLILTQIFTKTDKNFDALQSKAGISLNFYPQTADIFKGPGGEEQWKKT